MQQAILAGRDAAPAEWIRNKTDFAPQEQLAVYLEGYRYRLFDTVAEEYPVLAHYLGEAKFNTLLEEFIEAVPATHFNIGHYAHKLPDFLAQHKSGDAFASELATLEATLSQLHDAKESEALTPEHLAGMTAEALMEAPLALRAASALLAFAYPVNAYYGAVVKQSAPTPPAPQASYLALLRHDDQLWRLPLEEAEYALLTLLAQGLPVGAALELLGESATASLEEWQGKLSAWFGSWIRNGLLARYEVTDSNTRSAA